MTKPPSVRVIAGKYKGRRLPIVSTVSGLRPTADRTRETLFNWLMSVTPLATCLDLYAGTGALGIEALSRGATSVDFVEQDLAACEQLRKNLSNLKLDTSCIHPLSVASFLIPTAGRPLYDIVFIDPPFHQDLVNSTVRQLELCGCLADEAWIYVEQERTSPIIEHPDTWVTHRELSTKQTRAILYKRVA